MILDRKKNHLDGYTDPRQFHYDFVEIGQEIDRNASKIDQQNVEIGTVQVGSAQNQSCCKQFNHRVTASNQ